jgi:lipopolysaccharide/colanic/teichoic acid biosynthesis glycosyltransferase
MRLLVTNAVVQVVVGLIITSLVAALVATVFAGREVEFLLRDPNAFNSLLLGQATILLALLMFRRVELFPGVGVMANVLPSVAISIGTVVIAVLVLRVEYARLILIGTSVALTAYLVCLGLLGRVPHGQAYYLVPSPGTLRLASIPGVRWIEVRNPQFTPEPDGIIIADLREDLSDDWERRITEWVLAGYEVFHSKQVFEMMTGRVQIEHLSENSFGSLAPSKTYAVFKRLFDIVVSIALLPVLLPLFAVVAAAVRLDSNGPVFFRQDRIGFRGKQFTVVKFRTMRQASCSQDARSAAMTAVNDARITRLGSFLRRSRIDELPQVFNVLRGDMSWIGPRPEALPLSNWYKTELPYYPYRHVVRPGVTGWAQVNQGHVTGLDEVLEKLHYDFYYIKKFSLWIDLTIAVRTLVTVVTGFGAR